MADDSLRRDESGGGDAVFGMRPQDFLYYQYAIFFCRACCGWASGYATPAFEE